MNEKFTQGEWFVEDFNAINTADKNICRCIRMGMDAEETQANAALIASASTLYKMLKLACHELTIVADWCGENGMKGDEQCYYNLVNAIQDVLKKARGEE